MKPKIIRIMFDKFSFEQHEPEEQTEIDSVEEGHAAISFSTPEEMNFPDETHYVIQSRLEIDFADDGYSAEAVLIGTFGLSKEDLEKFQNAMNETSENEKEVRAFIDPLMSPLIDKFRTYIALLSEEALNYVEIPNISFEKD